MNNKSSRLFLGKNSTTYFISIFLIIFCISLFNIVDVHSAILNLTNSKSSISMQDIIIYAVYGINSLSRDYFIDILRFSIPFLLCLFYISIFLVDVLQKGYFYCSVIRYKNYRTWLRTIFLKNSVFITIFFVLYYLNLLFISGLYTKNIKGFTTSFYTLNPCLTNGNFFVLLLYQYLLSISFSLLLLVLLMLFSFILKSISKSFIIITIIIIVLTSLGCYNVFNPIMLCKQAIINYTFYVQPIWTIAFFLIISLILLTITKLYIKLLVRGK